MVRLDWLSYSRRLGERTFFFQLLPEVFQICAQLGSRLITHFAELLQSLIDDPAQCLRNPGLG